MNNLTKEDLKKILLTSDGKGKEIKKKALEELLFRAFCDGKSDVLE